MIDIMRTFVSMRKAGPHNVIVYADLCPHNISNENDGRLYCSVHMTSTSCLSVLEEGPSSVAPPEVSSSSRGFCGSFSSSECTEGVVCCADCKAPQGRL